jgi:hypothetical protein
MTRPPEDLPPGWDGPPVEITDDDVFRARLAWRRLAPPEFRDILNATPEGADAP